MGKKQTAGQTPVRVAVKDLPTIRIDELIPYENNAKIHGPEQIEQLRRSLREFGFVSPVLIDEDKNLIAGHGRVEAARAEGMIEVPYVTVSDLTEAQRRAYIIADNRLAETGEWDAARLKFEMEELNSLSFDTSLTGFTMDNVPLLSGDEPAGGPEAQEDDYDGSMPEETSVRDGDLWKLGGHRLMVGSTSSKKSVERLMNGVKANMVFTDPPYGVAVGSKNKMLDDVAGGKSGRCTENIYGDTMSESELHDMLLAAMRNIREACAEDASYYVTSPQGGSLGLMMMMMEAGLQVRHMLIWRKSSPTFSMGRLNYDYQHEPIFYTWTKRHNWYGKGKFHTSVWDVEKPRKCDLHPTMKPVALVENALLNSSAAGDVVLDGFGGSGTTLIACEQLGRICYMMEIDPHYAQVIIDRWEKLTGEKAELIDDDR
nr:MAG TPA: adenine specific DNA methyltransferase [Caudoviricetes sp.]